MKPHRRLLLAALAAAWAPLASAQGPERGATVAGSFDAIDIAGSAVVRIVQGDADQAVVEGGDDAKAATDLSISRGTLHISPNGDWKFWNTKRVAVTVTLRSLRRLSVSGAADVTAPGPLRASSLTVDISGAGLARFDQLQADELRFSVSGQGDGQVAGTAERLRVRISGHSEFKGENLKSRVADVSVSGVGELKLWVTQELAVSISGVGTVDYWGSPTVKRSVAGVGTLNDRGPKRAGS